MPHLGRMLLMEESRPVFVVGFRKEKKENEALLSTIQVEQGLRKGEPTYLAALLEVKLDKVVEILNEIAGMLEEF